MSIYRALKNIYWPCGELRARQGDYFEAYEDHKNKRVASLGQKWFVGYDSFVEKNTDQFLDADISTVPSQYIRQLRMVGWDGKSPGDKMMSPDGMNNWMYTKKVPTQNKLVRMRRAKYLRLTNDGN
jgi:hypothetical protein